ncbi:MAG: hypothetical protein ACKO12_02850 [Actinomycetota bacterium]
MENVVYLKHRCAVFRYLVSTSSVREIVGVQAFEGHLYSNSKMINELTSTFHSWILGNLEQ